MFQQRGGWAFWMLSASSLLCPVNVLPSETRMLSARAPKAARPFMCPCLYLFSCAWGWGSNRTIHLAGLGPIRSWDPGDLESVVPLLTAINSRQEPHSDADAKDLWCWSLPWIPLPHRWVQTLNVITRPLSTLCFTQNWTSPSVRRVCMRLELNSIFVQPDQCFRTFCLRWEHELFSQWNQMWGNVKTLVSNCVFIFREQTFVKHLLYESLQ